MVLPQGNSMGDQEPDNLKLRRAIHKLKVENSRMKSKIKSLTTTVQQLVQASGLEDFKNKSAEAEKDYDEIGRDFLLLGGPKDPLGMRYEVLIKDDKEIQHKSSERYYWYKMAEFFKDNKAMEKIKDAKTGNMAETAKKEIKNFNQKKWDEVKQAYWEEAQTYKLQQVRWIANLLIASESIYLAVCSLDKEIGIGWRKNREESGKPFMWEGDNRGGKFLMNYRQHLKTTHTWLGPNEELEAKNKFKELRPVWRRSDPEQLRTERRIGVPTFRGRARGRSLRGGAFARRGRGEASFSRGNVYREFEPSPWQDPSTSRLFEAPFQEHPPYSGAYGAYSLDRYQWR